MITGCPAYLDDSVHGMGTPHHAVATFAGGVSEVLRQPFEPSAFTRLAIHAAAGGEVQASTEANEGVHNANPGCVDWLLRPSAIAFPVGTALRHDPDGAVGVLNQRIHSINRLFGHPSRLHRQPVDADDFAGSEADQECTLSSDEERGGPGCGQGTLHDGGGRDETKPVETDESAFGTEPEVSGRILGDGVDGPNWDAVPIRPGGDEIVRQRRLQLRRSAPASRRERQRSRARLPGRPVCDVLGGAWAEWPEDSRDFYHLEGRCREIPSFRYCSSGGVRLKSASSIRAGARTMPVRPAGVL